jgi:hypothetical protein
LLGKLTFNVLSIFPFLFKIGMSISVALFSFQLSGDFSTIVRLSIRCLGLSASNSGFRSTLLMATGGRANFNFKIDCNPATKWWDARNPPTKWWDAKFNCWDSNLK